MLVLEPVFVLLAIALAWLNKWTVYKFRETGASKQMESEFHGANGLVKILCAFPYGFICAIFDWANGAQIFLILLLILWLVFDLALNKFTGKKLFYVGNTAKLDKLQRKHLGRYAGQIKAGVCLGLIGLLNWLYYSL